VEIILKLIKTIIYYNVYHSNFIYLCTLNGIEIKKFGACERSKENGEFDSPFGLAVDEHCLYVCDYRNHRIQVVTKDNGNFIRQWGSEGLIEKSTFYFPNSILLYDELLYVGDMYRVQVFTIEGEFIHYIGTDKGYYKKRQNQGSFDIARGLCIVDARIYVSDTYNHRIQVFT